MGNRDERNVIVSVGDCGDGYSRLEASGEREREKEKWVWIGRGDEEKKESGGFEVVGTYT